MEKQAQGMEEKKIEVQKQNLGENVSHNNEELNKISDICGIIMPISGSDEYSESHWSDVKRILQRAIKNAGYDSQIVSEADDSGVIHKRIVQNLYDNPIVVCDISGRNPNVMFELGLRLAFDKPTIIVKDNKTSFSFDTSVIEHLQYPVDLRFGKIEEFIESLSLKITHTMKIYNDNPSDYSTFLKNFGKFVTPKIEETQVPLDKYVIDELHNITNKLNRLENLNSSRVIERASLNQKKLEQSMGFKNIELIVEKNIDIKKLSGITPILLTMEGVHSVKENISDSYNILIRTSKDLSIIKLKKDLEYMGIKTSLISQTSLAIVDIASPLF